MTLGNNIKPRCSFLLLAQSSDAALWSFPLTPERDSNAHLENNVLQRGQRHKEKKTTSLQWDADVEALHQDGPSKDQISEKAMAKHHELDCRWAWLSMYLTVSCQYVVLAD